MRTPACGLWMMLVVARQRCREGGKTSRLMVKHSCRPSIRLAAAEGYCGSSHAASFLRRAKPSFGPSFQAARSTHLV